MTHNYLIHAQAKVDSSASISNGNKILANASLANNVTLGNNVLVGAGVMIGQNSSIGSHVTLEGYLPVEDRFRYETVSVGDSKPSERPEAEVLSLEKKKTIIHDHVSINDQTSVGKGTIIHAKVTVGKNCYIGENVEIGQGSVITNNCILHNNVSLSPGSVINDKVILEANSHFSIPINVLKGTRIGENITCQTRKKLRAINPEGIPYQNKEISPVYIHKGVFIGKDVTLTEGATIGEWAMVADHATISGYVPPHAIITGFDQVRGFACACENILTPSKEPDLKNETVEMICPICHEKVDIPTQDYQRIEEPLAPKTILANFLRNPD